MPVSFVLLLVINLDLGVARIQTTRLVRLRFGFTKANIFFFFSKLNNGVVVIRRFGSFQICSILLGVQMCQKHV